MELRVSISTLTYIQQLALHNPDTNEPTKQMIAYMLYIHCKYWLTNKYQNNDINIEKQRILKISFFM